jgi:hypothetical protein
MFSFLLVPLSRFRKVSSWQQPEESSLHTLIADHSFF